jgi:hypothetical protein
MALQLQTYSFVNVVAALVGPGAPGIPIGSDAGSADEGITVEYEEDKNQMTGGSDGSVMHVLRAGNRGHITIRLLLTSPVNGLLMLAYNFQKQSSNLWGVNTLTISDIARGDLVNAQQVAFKKGAGTTYSKDGQLREWPFDVGQLEQIMALVP